LSDLTPVIAPKSDQLNADDLIAGPRTIRISRVTVGGGEQPVSINFEGDGGKPYKPCKSMSRLLAYLWGPNADSYVGRSLTLYRDPKVKWAGIEVGGIRISHMSDIRGEATLALTVTKGNKKQFTVRPLQNNPERSGTAREAPSDNQGTQSAAPPPPPPPLDWFLYTLTDPKTGDARTTSDGKKWADHLVAQIGKLPFDAARALHEANKPNVALAMNGGEDAFKNAVRVSEAWQRRNADNDEVPF